MARSVEDLVGRKINRLLVQAETRKPGTSGRFYVCLCDCGNETLKYGGHLRSGEAVSCGCAQRSVNRTHGMSGTPEYRAWDNARSRCHRAADAKYPLYGGRGIAMCDAWRQSFPAFFAELGPRPSAQHSLERNDGNRGYEPGNCRWATAEEQNNNRSINRHLVVGGERMTVAQASRVTGLPHGTILARLDAGKTDAEAVRG